MTSASAHASASTTAHVVHLAHFLHFCVSPLIASLSATHLALVSELLIDATASATSSIVRIVSADGGASELPTATMRTLLSLFPAPLTGGAAGTGSGSGSGRHVMMMSPLSDALTPTYLNSLLVVRENRYAGWCDFFVLFCIFFFCICSEY